MGNKLIKEVPVGRSGTTTEPLAVTCYRVAILLMGSNQCVQEIFESGLVRASMRLK